MKIIRESSLPLFCGDSFFDVFDEKKGGIAFDQDVSCYKWSKYNVVEEFDDSTIVYNLASDGIVRFEKSEIAGLFHEEKLEKWRGNRQVIEILVRIGALIPRENNEELILSMVRQKKLMHPDNELKIAINTTYGCNARCDYCFECDADHSKMDNDTADKVADYICKAINKDTLLTYRWFGGEPLLASDIIDRIIMRVNSFFDNKLKYRSVILSNGTIYNDAIITKMLNLWHVYEVHVTLDGTRETHNKKKNFVDKNLDGYTRVMTLIRTLLENKIVVACRINVDKQNMDSINDILVPFDSMPNKDLLNVYVALTRRHTKSSEDYSFDYSEYNDVFDKLFATLYEHKLLAGAETLVPKRKVTCCSSRATNELVIDTKGKFFKCMQTSTTDQRCVGNCTDGLILNDELSQWLIPKTPAECVDCLYMPICQGGCKGFRALNNPLVSPCVNEKHYLKTILKYVNLMSKEG